MIVRGEIRSWELRFLLTLGLFFFSFFYPSPWNWPLVVCEIFHLSLFILPKLLKYITLEMLRRAHFQKICRLLYDIFRAPNNSIIAEQVMTFLYADTFQGFQEEELVKIRYALDNLDNVYILSRGRISAFFLPGVVLLLKDRVKILIDDLTISKEACFCPVCLESMTLNVKLPCGSKDNKHSLCTYCFGYWFIQSSQCPICRINIG